MITQPEANIQFTDDQTKQLETFKSQLISIQTEITIHSSNLRGLQTDIVKATKEKQSLEAQISDLQKKVSDLTVEFNTIEFAMVESKNRLETAHQEADALKVAHTSTQTQLTQQTQDLSVQQAGIQADRAKLDTQLTQFAQDSALLQKKHTILSEAIKAIGN